MKKAQREIYQILANEVDYSICTFCKYEESYGSCCDYDVDLECHHPLFEKSWAFEEQVENAANLGDCWGFRPRHPVSFVADVIGTVLEKGWSSASCWQNKDSVWEIAGRIYEET